MKVAVYEGPKQLKIAEAPDKAITPAGVRIETMYSGISHGTEMNFYRGNAPMFRKIQDPKTKLFVNEDNAHNTLSYPLRSCDPGVWFIGYSSVGRVTEIGSEVENIKVGDIVYSNSPHQSQVVKDQKDVFVVPAGVKPENAVVFTNLMTAYNGILDANIKLGDTVVVSGLGVLGQLVAQMAKMSGAFQVFGVDVLDKRLDAALANGADKVFNSKTCDDVAMEIRKLTNQKGADVVIEVSGNQRALREAIRIAAYDTTVVALGWYNGLCADLDLSEEFHHNRITLRSSQAGGVNPAISNMWNGPRRKETGLKLLSRLSLDNIITHKIPYNDIAKAYEMIDNNPGEIIQVVLEY